MAAADWASTMLPSKGADRYEGDISRYLQEDERILIGDLPATGHSQRSVAIPYRELLLLTVDAPADRRRERAGHRVRGGFGDVRPATRTEALIQLTLHAYELSTVAFAAENSRSVRAPALCTALRRSSREISSSPAGTARRRGAGWWC